MEGDTFKIMNQRLMDNNDINDTTRKLYIHYIRRLMKDCFGIDDFEAKKLKRTKTIMRYITEEMTSYSSQKNMVNSIVGVIKCYPRNFNSDFITCYKNFQKSLLQNYKQQELEKESGIGTIDKIEVNSENTNVKSYSKRNKDKATVAVSDSEVRELGILKIFQFMRNLKVIIENEEQYHKLYTTRQWMDLNQKYVIMYLAQWLTVPGKIYHIMSDCRVIRSGSKKKGRRGKKGEVGDGDKDENNENSTSKTKDQSVYFDFNSNVFHCHGTKIAIPDNIRRVVNHWMKLNKTGYLLINTTNSEKMSANGLSKYMGRFFTGLKYRENDSMLENIDTKGKEGIKVTDLRLKLTAKIEVKT